MAEAIDALAAEIRSCRICRDHPAGGPSKALPHEPRPVAILSRQARILIAGQAPGLRVHQTGLPFNDASGDRLRSWMGVDRVAFYDPARFAILPMGFCFPGYDRHGADLPPRPECAPLWRARALALMPQIRLVLAVGGHAQAWHLGRDRPKGMTETVQAFRVFLAKGVLPLPHPSWRNTGWLKRNPWFEIELLPVLRSEVLRWTS